MEANDPILGIWKGFPSSPPSGRVPLQGLGNNLLRAFDPQLLLPTRVCTALFPEFFKIADGRRIRNPGYTLWGTFFADKQIVKPSEK